MKNTGFISSGIYSDSEGRKTLAWMLRIMLIVAIAIIPAVLLLRFFGDHQFSATDVAMLVLLAIFIACYFFLRKGNPLPVVIIFVLSGWLAMTFMAARSAGIRDVSVIGYIVLIFLSTLFLGYRFAILIAVLSLLSSWAMAIAEFKNLLIPYKDTPIEYARDFTFFFILFTVIIVIFEASFRYSINRINKELQERIIAEEKLSANEKRLLESNEELLKAKVKAEESDRLKTAFLQNISHEIRTPMNGIIGFSELIRDPGTDDPRRREYFDQMTACTFQLAALVNDLIDISKIEAGDIDLTVSEFSTGDIIKKATALYDEKAREKGLDLIFDDKTANTGISSDEGKICHVVNNLIDNAIKFTSSGSVRVMVEAVNKNLVVKVKDSGIGISKDHMTIIFDRFRQADMGLSRPYGGAGLGLSIVSGLAGFMKGNIAVESEPGKGSLFTFSVPVEFTGKS